MWVSGLIGVSHILDVEKIENRCIRPFDRKLLFHLLSDSTSSRLVVLCVHAVTDRESMTFHAVFIQTFRAQPFVAITNNSQESVCHKQVCVGELLSCRKSTK